MYSTEKEAIEAIKNAQLFYKTNYTHIKLLYAKIEPAALTERVKSQLTKLNGYIVCDFDQASDDLLKKAVTENPAVIGRIKNPSVEVQCAAVKKSSYALRYIQDPSDEACNMALDKSINVFPYILNPSYNTQKNAVHRRGEMIQFVPEQTEELQLLALRDKGQAATYGWSWRAFDIIPLFKNPSKKVIMELAKAIKSCHHGREEANFELLMAIDPVAMTTEIKEELFLWDQGTMIGFGYDQAIIDKYYQEIESPYLAQYIVHVFGDLTHKVYFAMKGLLSEGV